MTCAGAQARGGPVQLPVDGASSPGRSTVCSRGAASRWPGDTVYSSRNHPPGGTVWGLPVTVRTPLRYHASPGSLVQTSSYGAWVVHVMSEKPVRMEAVSSK